ncbi:pyruvate dehydrogenase (acetyl-transferring) E1 component subunit alpha [bacterium]|nr:pyruvate dehydrogenase (acetyl-transferring) E1 component subunit alpha [bacterium]MBU1984390.1 pyruvate dehydrogenase (acetyl-transferring) E1 component subunit alpha [bacterium]
MTAEQKTATRRSAKPSTGSLFEAFDPLRGRRLEILDENGKVVGGEWMPELSDEKLLHAYKMMLLARVADLKAVSLQRQGRLYTLPPSLGQEACAVGSAITLEKEDWMVPAYRELGAWLVRGVPLSRVYLYFAGSEYGNVYPPGVRVLPTSVPISSQLLHAVGIGHAINYRNRKEVVITYFGDGGTSEGDFHEALNWAAVFHCPVIFFCNNNQYAISHPRARQTISETIAQKAIAYGMPGIQVDGNDFLAVYRATQEAASHARAGRGPVLIEGVTYRMGAHTTSDDPSKYRESEEEELWKARDPLIRMRKYLEAKGLWDETREEDAKTEAQAKADEDFAEAEKWKANSVDEIFAHVFESTVPELEAQAESLKSFRKWKEGR